MVNKPKAIGTRAETAVLRVLAPYWPEARRNALAGSADLGDIGGCGDLVFEVKGGKAADAQAPGKIEEWIAQAHTEATNTFNLEVQRGTRQLDGAPILGVLVTQRAGYGAGNAHRWWAWLDASDLATILGGYHDDGKITPVRLELGHLLAILSDQGWVMDAPAALEEVSA